MKAVVLRKVTNSDDITIENVEMPKIKDGWVLVKVLGFGLNHSEFVLRTSEINASYINKPIIPGIECVGRIEQSLDERYKKGDLVCSMMGGMGRNYNGSYAQYTLIPINKVFHIHSNLPIEYLSAIPETYFTAWGSLFECLRLNKNDILLVRGATSALGYASMQLAKALGCRVIGTTHKQEKMHFITDLGCEAILDNGNIQSKIYATKVLELIGPKTLRDSLKCLYKNGICCNTGILGGEYYLQNFNPIKEIPNGVYLTGFFSNYPTQEIVDNIFNYVEQHKIKPFISKVFNFKEIKNAIKYQERGANGKIVVICNN